MRIRILRQTSISGRPARPGDLLEVSASDARLLLGMGKAEAALDPESRSKAAGAPAATPRKPRKLRKG